MKITKVNIKNYRLLQDVSLNLEKETTLIVGRNNSGKTSLTEIFRSFISGSKPSLQYEDFNIDALGKFRDAFHLFLAGENDLVIRAAMPEIELSIEANYSDDAQSYGILGDFILDLNPEQFDLRIKMIYGVNDGHSKSLFNGIDEGIDEIQFYRHIKKTLSQHYDVKIFALDISDETNLVEIEFSKLRRLLGVNFINAQRGLDDETHNEKDVLGKTLGKIFRSASSANAPVEFKEKSKGINDVADELQERIDREFQEKVNQLLPALAIFGYPGLSEANLSANTEFNAKAMLENNTKVKYQKNSHFQLPETYNGLGSRNLMHILFKIYEFFRDFQSEEHRQKCHLIFIEEPEAHLHPQMQEVFIRQLSKIIDKFEEDLNNNEKWPVQFVVSTHSSHIANEADFESIRYFMRLDDAKTEIRDLSQAFSAYDSQSDKNFLHNYLTLSKCDMYFADKIILVEGAAERILLPEIVKKVDETFSTSLRTQYISLIEIGGAYAHHFYKFLDFLKLKTLVITDLDCAVLNPSSRRYSKTRFATSTHSTNAGIKFWFGLQMNNSPAQLIAKTEQDKTHEQKRIAYQVPEPGITSCGRTFEDAFFLANLNKFNIDESLSDGEKEEESFRFAEEVAEQSKAEFAIMYSVADSDWSVPKYIADGLIWLADNSAIVEGE